MGFENTNAHDPDSKESFCFAPGVPVFLQKKKCWGYFCNVSASSANSAFTAGKLTFSDTVRGSSSTKR